jgi:hypothetical protein
VFDKALYVFAPDKGHMVAEAAAKEVKKTMAVAVLFAAHLAELLGLFGEMFAKTLGEIVVDAGVFLFQPHGQGEDFPFVKTLK